MQFGFMPGKGTIDAVFILRRIQEEYLSNQKKLYMCSVILEKAFNRVPRKVAELAMRKKGIPEALIRPVMSLYKGAKTKVTVGTHLSEEFEVNVGVHKGSVLSPLLVAIVIDVVMNEIKKSTLQEILYADDLVLIVETMAELLKHTCSWESALESKFLKVNLMKTMVMESSKKDQCGIVAEKQW